MSDEKVNMEISISGEEREDHKNLHARFAGMENALARHVTEEVLAAYSLQLIGPKTNPGLDTAPGFQRLVDRVLAETEENATDLLPDGYSVRIREWDAEEETPHE